MRNPAFLTVPELGRLLRLRRLSSKLVSACLERLDRLGPTYEAVVQVHREDALAEARERDAELARGKDRGPLHGIPYGVKALVSHDATVVRRLRRAGALLCGTLTVAETASGAGDAAGAGLRTVGRTPWDVSRWAGGFLERLRDDGRCRTAALYARIRDLRLDPVSGGVLRRERVPAHIRPREPARRGLPEPGTSIAGAANLCGAPGLFLPNGWGEAGLPTSLQLTAGAEAVLLQLGMEFQARTNFHRRRPPGL